METFHPVLVWVIAVIEHWHGYVSGAAVGFFLEVFERLKGWKPNKKVFAVILICGFLVSIFDTWREEYNKTHPGLRIEIVQIGVGDGYTKDDSKIFLTAAVSNVGDPTIADAWRLSIQPVGGATVSAETAYVDPSNPIVLNFSNGQQTKLNGSDVLYNKTMTGPIQSGMKEVGILAFTVNLPRELLEKVGTKFTLQCKDVDENIVQTTREWSGKNTDLMFFPGMSPLPK